MTERVTRIDRLGPIRFDRKLDWADRRDEDGIVARLTADGYLRVEGRISGCGVYDYEDDQGEEWGELRTPEEVFDAESLASFAMVPVTDDHPAEWVNSSNIKNVQCGQLGSQLRPSGDYVVADMLVTDADLIEKIKAGKTELSCGYTCIPVSTTGVVDGRPYMFRQTDIRGNHLSVVDAARGGPMCSLILDSKGAIHRGKDSMKVQKKNAKIVVEGTEVEVPDAVAEELARLQAKVEEQGAELAKLSAGPVEGEAEAEVDEDEPGVEPVAEETVMASKDSKKAKDSKPEVVSSAKDRARIDALEATLKARNEEFPARVDARVNLVTAARRILGSDIKTDGVSDLSLMRSVVAKVTPAMKSKVDAASLDYVTAAYEMALDADASRTDSTGDLGTLVFQAAQGDSTFDADAAYAAHLDRRANNYRAARKETV